MPEVRQPVPKMLPLIATGARAIRPPPASVRRRAYTPGELAGALGVHPSSVYRWCAKGLLRADTSAGFTLIKLDEAIRFSREGPRRT